MKPEGFEEKMGNLNTPKAEAKPPVELKLAILNAQRSATMGIWFIVVPCFFLACVVMKYFFHINLGLLDTFEKTILAIDKNPATWWIQPVLLLGLPVVGIILNALAITHFYYSNNTLTVTLKLKWLNLIIIGICLAIVLTFLGYLFVENFQPSHTQ